MSGHILLVDDEKLTRETLDAELTDEGFQVSTTASPFEALEILDKHDIDVIITDLRMPSMDGLEFQRRVRQRGGDPAILFITAFGTVQSAVEAMRQGAVDYLTKPLDTEDLLIRLRRLVQRRRELSEIKLLRLDAARRHKLGKVVFHSAAMAAVIDRAMAVADTDVTVLLEGETGTGKEVVAVAIHEASSRAQGPFVAVNCAGLNPNLVESELFGHEAGAFTGASRQRKGRIEIAAGGTLFIDEVDDLTPEIQVRLLRFLNDRTFERVGGSKTLKGDTRVLCATKRSLPDLVRAGRFREDLYYRINTVVIVVPALRGRREDIIPLAEHFARVFTEARHPPKEPQLSPELLHALRSYDWPGNVRELMHAMEHARARSARGARRRRPRARRRGPRGVRRCARGGRPRASAGRGRRGDARGCTSRRTGHRTRARPPAPRTGRGSRGGTSTS
jgi:DNA-binding NtrC family response regulator